MAMPSNANSGGIRLMNMEDGASLIHVLKTVKI